MPRRTQAERREATQTALLEATLECLVEYGYANVTTTKIVEHAGVSRGAQGHYFKTKQELVVAALRHLARKLTAEYREHAMLAADQDQRLDVILDRLWEVHRSPTFAASLELFTAARTDPELREGLVDVEREIAREIAAGAGALVKGPKAERALLDLVSTALATMRGLAMLHFVSEEYVEERWRSARAQLLGLLPATLGR